MRKTPATPTYSFTLPDHIPVSQHVGQIMVLGTYPNQQKIEVTYVSRINREIRYKILPKN